MELVAGARKPSQSQAFKPMMGLEMGKRISTFFR
jgi:hypothetical protein